MAVQILRLVFDSYRVTDKITKECLLILQSIKIRESSHPKKKKKKKTKKNFWYEYPFLI